MLYFERLGFLHAYNLIYRGFSYKMFNFFFYKLLFAINRYFVIRQLRSLRNIRLVNMKWATPIMNFRQGRDDFIYAENRVRTGCLRYMHFLRRFTRQLSYVNYKMVCNVVVLRNLYKLRGD